MPKVFVRKSFSVSQASGIENFYDKMGYVTIFCRFFLSRSTENLRRGNPSAFHKTSCVEEICGHVGMEQVSHFSFKLFCLTAPKNFVKKPSTVALVSGIENFYDKRGYVTISCRFILSCSSEKVCRGNFLCCVSGHFC